MCGVYLGRWPNMAALLIGADDREMPLRLARERPADLGTTLTTSLAVWSGRSDLNRRPLTPGHCTCRYAWSAVGGGFAGAVTCWLSGRTHSVSPQVATAVALPLEDREAVSLKSVGKRIHSGSGTEHLGASCINGGE